MISARSWGVQESKWCDRGRTKEKRVSSFAHRGGFEVVSWLRVGLPGARDSGARPHQAREITVLCEGEPDCRLGDTTGWLLRPPPVRPCLGLIELTRDGQINVIY